MLAFSRIAVTGAYARRAWSLRDAQMGKKSAATALSAAAQQHLTAVFKLLDIDIFTTLEMGCAWRTRWLLGRAARLFVQALKA